MNPLYTANPDHTLGYAGNRICRPLKRISDEIDVRAIERPLYLRKRKEWLHISRINRGINFAMHDYFRDLGSAPVLSPMTTRMLSSPKLLYGKSSSSDARHFGLDWFGVKGGAFLQQSAQIYMELSVLPKGVDSVYCISNSFRGENADATHLVEFHMIDFEAKISQKQNKRIISGLLRSIINRLLSENAVDLQFFLFDEDIDYLRHVSKRGFGTEITFEQALDLLYSKTKNSRYKKFTMENFHTWEEVMLTTELDDMAVLTELPFADVAFYQAPLNRNRNEVSDSADFIWPGFCEIAGGGHRARSAAELLKAIKRYNLPMRDYKYYLETRKSPDYVETSGFGMGWERLLQAIIKMPYIYSALGFPRVHSTIYP